MVKTLLKEHGYVKRKAMKTQSTGEFSERNRQFEKISRLKSNYKREGNPIISIDTKKKEALGNLYRDGKLYCQEADTVYDHDFPGLAEGSVIPHGIYDIEHNDAMINIGTCAETSEFACDSIKLWWEKIGRDRYLNATSLLILADCGGSNGYRHHVFKEALQALANDIGLEIRMAHYPPYTSKWNPIEHRLFPHVTRAMSGVIFRSYEVVQALIESTRTETGLTVTSNIIHKIYEKGKKCCHKTYDNGTIIFDRALGKLNYKIKPATL
ncbi:ISAzo13 family transposase [bacterium]|nr:ISAzo13 family transposase [bacterium]